MSASTPKNDSRGRNADVTPLPPSTPIDHSIEYAFDLANKLEATQNKLQVYQDEDMPAPQSLLVELRRDRKALDRTMSILLQKESSLVGSILGSDRLKGRESPTLEDSYARVLGMFTDQSRPSKLFYLPFLHRRTTAQGEEVIDFSSQTPSGLRRREKLAQMIRNFIEEYHLLDASDVAEEAVLGLRFGEPLMDWTIGEEDEKHVPALHEAIVQGQELDMSLFAHRQSFLSASVETLRGTPEWTLGVLPFTLSWPDEDVLEELTFRPDGYEFQDMFEQAFDVESEIGGYGEPIEAAELSNMRVLMVWQQLVRENISAAHKKVGRGDLLIVNVGFAMDRESKELDLIELSLQVGPPDAGEEHSTSQMKFAQLISRVGVMGELEIDIMEFLMDMDELVGSNVRVVIAREWSDNLDEHRLGR